jgi:hypothetical protein
MLARTARVGGVVVSADKAAVIAAGSADMFSLVFFYHPALNPSSGPELR